MTDEKTGKEPYPDDKEELPIRGDDVGGKVPYPSEIEETTQRHPEESYVDEF